MRGFRGVVAMAALVGMLASGPLWSAEKLINGFENANELADWEISPAGSKLVAEGVTEGKTALEMTFDPQGQWAAASLNWRKLQKDWSPYDVLVVDVFNPNPDPVSARVLIGDEAWDAKSTYWNRHNGGTFLAPGASRWVIPVQGLYRGEAGSRNNDIKTDIDPTRITRLTLSFGSRGQTGRIVVDNIRFVKSDRPAGVGAFDFGPSSQAVMPGWTPVNNTTVYGQGQSFGWNAAMQDGSARDTTFGIMLTQDFVEARGYTFRTDVPAGVYDVFVIFENAGYWGGEQSRHKVRTIASEGKEVWREDRPDGSATPLYQFENIEPVGVDIWDTYMMGHLIKPVRLQVTAGNNGLQLRFDADAPWSSKVSAIEVHRAGDAAAKKWLDEQVVALAQEFRDKAVNLDGAAPKWTPQLADQARGLAAWAVRIEDEVTPTALPPTNAGPLQLSCVAVKGEYEPVCLVVKPTRDLGQCDLAVEWTGGKSLPTTVSVVRYNTSRGFGTIGYRIRPFSLRDGGKTTLPAEINREWVMTIKVPQDAAAGEYVGEAKLTGANGQTLLTVPVKATVRDVTLGRKTSFLMGFFGLFPNRTMVGDRYYAYLEQTLDLLREHGMNALTSAPTMTLTGWNNGEPVSDFTEADRVYAVYRKCGFELPIGAYGSVFVGVHGRYVKGPEGERVERESGLPYQQALVKAWEAVDKHARANNWPTIYYTLCDETRVREVAEEEIKFMKMMAEVSKRFPRTVRTLGSYSVNFRNRPTDLEDMNYWHQRFFEVLDISSLNSHDQSVMDEAKRLGKEIHIYNQGRDRYSFGLYQWSEFAKGVTARWQWHLNVLHGYQFFDLDGREPDPAMIVYGRSGISPTIAFERCREGAEDFYLYQTLSDLIDANRKAGRKAAETDRAAAMLKQMTDSVALNQRSAPAGYDPYTAKLTVIDAIESIR